MHIVESENIVQVCFVICKAWKNDSSRGILDIWEMNEHKMFMLTVQLAIKFVEDGQHVLNGCQRVIECFINWVTEVTNGGVHLLKGYACHMFA